MTALAELQRNFISDCLSENINSKKPLLAKDIDISLISASGLMGIYRSSAIANIIYAMKLTYPVIEKLVGEDFFRASCKKFILSHCPKSANMDDYGQEFGSFLANFEPAKQLTYLKSVAQLEWYYHLSSLDDDSKPVDWSLLSSIDALHVKLLLAPSVKLITSPFPVNNIWQMNQSNAYENKPIDISLEQETLLIIFRSGLSTKIMTVTAGEFALLLSFSKQYYLNDAIEIATAKDNTISIDDTLKKFIELNIISGFENG